MASRRIVITGATFPMQVEQELRAGGFEIETVPGDLDEAGVIAALETAWGYVLGGSERMSRTAWAQLPDLRLVCFLGTGYGSFIEIPDDRGKITFTYTPHANAVAVAEFTLALMLDLVRQVSPRVKGVSEGRWSEEATRSLVGARLGVAGLGHIGREVARMAHAAFGMEVYYWNRSRRPEFGSLPYAPVSSIAELCEVSDVVSVNFAHQVGQNDGVIGEAELLALGADGYLVDAARAELVDPAALRTALAEGWIAGAALDGYYIEPTPDPDMDPHGLLAFVPDRLLVTPHCAYLSTQAVRRMADMAAENILAVSREDDAPYPIGTANE